MLRRYQHKQISTTPSSASSIFTSGSKRSSFLSSIFGGGDKKSDEDSSCCASSSEFSRPGELFIWPTDKKAVDPMKAALLESGAYIDQRVHWLPYTPEEIEYRQQTTLGPPLRMASLTVSEPVNNGTLLCCLPLDLCPAPVFVKQTPQLLPLFDNVKTEYSATVGEATFGLSAEPICSMLLMTFGVVAEGPLQKLFQAICEVENIDSRWEMLDPTSRSNKNNKKQEEGEEKSKSGETEKKSKNKQKEDDYLDDAFISEQYINQLATCLPQGQEQYLHDLLSARMIVLRELYEDCFGPGKQFEAACQFEDFCTIAALFQSRSTQAPEAIADALHGLNVYIPFYDCADHDPEQPSALGLRIFRNPVNEIPENVKENERSRLTSADRVPKYVTPACQMSQACVGIFADRDLIPKEPLTRKFDREYPKMRHEGNLGWLMHHGSVPWEYPENNK